MDRKFEPVMPGRQTPRRRCRRGVAARGRRRRCCRSAQNTVLRNTYWLLALSMLPTVAGAFVGMQLNFIALFKAAPIMTPLLMFGVMMGSLFVVTALRNSAWGVVALFGFTFIAGLMLTPILTVAAGFRNGGQLVALAGGHDGGDLLRDGDDRHGDQAGFLLHGQVPVHRADPADRRVARQHLLPDAGAVADDLGDRGADLLGLPAVRPVATSCAAARRTT